MTFDDDAESESKSDWRGALVVAAVMLALLSPLVILLLPEREPELLEKRQRLVDRIQAEVDRGIPEYQILVTLDEFFDGNHDEFSIAPNQWADTPRMSVREMYQVLKTLQARKDVEAVYVLIHQNLTAAEMEADHQLWVAGECVYVVGTIEPAIIENHIVGFEHTWVLEGWGFEEKPEHFPQSSGDAKVYAIAWD